MIELSLSGPEMSLRLEEWNGPTPQAGEYIDFEPPREGMTRVFGTVTRVHIYGSTPVFSGWRDSQYHVHYVVTVDGKQPGRASPERRDGR